MNPDFTHTELLTRYLDGELEGAPLQALELRMREDESLRQELETLQLSVQAIRSYGLSQKVGSVHAEMMKELKEEHGSRVVKMGRLLKNTLRMAASVIVIAGCLLLYKYITVSTQSLFQDNFHGYTLGENRGATAGSPLDGAYKSGDFSRVTSIFRQTEHRTARDYFIAGNAYLQQGNPKEAVNCFLSVSALNKEQQTHLYEDDAEYYLGMSYLQLNDPRKAIPVFEKIHADKDHLYHSRVSGWFIRNLHWLSH
jgi:tetratricopeptide (TPR) repeat protein